uniref:Uncharacterized protein n=1 Tax=viral metagenome TaxID=1070528 RepID=A0A6H1ZIV9_9ZZZZ
MIFNFDSITLSFLVVASVTLAVVSVLVWYVYSSKKFRQDMIDLMDEKLSNYLDNLEPPVQEAEEPQAEEEPHDFVVNTEPQKDETEFAEKAEEHKETAEELLQSFVEKPR